MILYFSGTGNSEYVAKRIGNELCEEVQDLAQKIRTNDFTEMHCDHPWIVVVPTYAWRIPRIVHNWLEKTNLAGNKNIYFIMTCGDHIGNAGEYLEKLCRKKMMKYMGCWGLKMPENYIAMFNTPTKAEALAMIQQAECVIDEIALMIKSNQPFSHCTKSLRDRITSGIVNDLFYPVFVHAKKFYTTDACNSCRKCVTICPLDNIHIENKTPKWGNNCTHCMACICHCPREAIEYGNHSKGLPRYICPKFIH